MLNLAGPRHGWYPLSMSNTPIEVIARGVLIDQGRVLVCQNKKHGHCFLPGGHVDFNEAAAVALAREVREELGVELEVGRFLGMCEAAFDQPSRKGEGVKRHHELNLVFLLCPPHPATFRAIDLASQEDHIQFVWIALSDLAHGSTRLLPTGIESLIALAEPADSNTLGAPVYLSVFT